MIGYSILHYANDREMQINEVFKILDGRIRLIDIHDPGPPMTGQFKGF